MLVQIGTKPYNFTFTVYLYIKTCNISTSSLYLYKHSYSLFGAQRVIFLFTYKPIFVDD